MRLNTMLPFTAPLGVEAIQRLIPHRAPMLLLDQIVAWEKDQQVEAVRTFAAHDPVFDGHFPDLPLVPGVLMLEALAQAAAVLVSLSKGLTSDEAGYLFTGVQDAKFRRPVGPDERLRLVVRLMAARLNVFRFAGEVWVGAGAKETRAVEAEFSAKLVMKA
jgi:3-hydroxyacyl-[acyl-carrier-protein] dehydratase